MMLLKENKKNIAYLTHFEWELNRRNVWTFVVLILVQYITKFSIRPSLRFSRRSSEVSIGALTLIFTKLPIYFKVTQAS